MTAENWIACLNLEPHVEGGYFRRVYQHSQQTEGRLMASSIFYLLKSGQVSRFHRLKSDEIWLIHAGSTLLIHRLAEDGLLHTDRLGMQIDQGDKLQVTVAANTVFGAEVLEKDSYCLVSCVVIPGFDYRDFELLDAQELFTRFPQHRKLLERFGAVRLD